MDGVSSHVDKHPGNVLPLLAEQENQRLQTVNDRNHDNGNERERCRPRCNNVNQVAKVDTHRWKHDSTNKINKNNHSHTHTAETTHIVKSHQLSKVMHS